MTTRPVPYERRYKGKRIHWDGFRWAVFGYGRWGDEPGQNSHRFKALWMAKAFIDRMQQQEGPTDKPRIRIKADFRQIA